MNKSPDRKNVKGNLIVDKDKEDEEKLVPTIEELKRPLIVPHNDLEGLLYREPTLE